MNPESENISGHTNEYGILFTRFALLVLLLSCIIYDKNVDVQARARTRSVGSF